VPPVLPGPRSESRASGDRLAESLLWGIRLQQCNWEKQGRKEEST
jgi:hypothetical protein